MSQQEREPSKLQRVRAKHCRYCDNLVSAKGYFVCHDRGCEHTLKTTRKDFTRMRREERTAEANVARGTDTGPEEKASTGSSNTEHDQKRMTDTGTDPAGMTNIPDNAEKTTQHHRRRSATPHENPAGMTNIPDNIETTTQHHHSRSTTPHEGTSRSAVKASNSADNTRATRPSKPGDSGMERVRSFVRAEPSTRPGAVPKEHRQKSTSTVSRTSTRVTMCEECLEVPDRGNRLSRFISRARRPRDSGDGEICN